jgi:sortase A
MSGKRASRLWVVECLLALAGFFCLGWYGVVTVRALQYQRAQSAKLDQAIKQRPAKENPTIQRPGVKARKADHQLIGKLEIPRIRLSVMVMDGDDDGTLKVAAGHLPDTPLPWEIGNSALAGHRDSFFKPLAGVKMSDRVRLVTPHGEFHYTVADLRIVEPNDLSVLAQNGRSSLTLVTCYPFSYVGKAPKRFIVRADHVPNGT